MPFHRSYSLPLLIALCLLTLGSAIPIPNGQLGKAEVECGEETIDVVFLTEDVFLGRIFVPGHANDTSCVSRETGKRSTSISIRKDQCGVVTIRSTNPPGLFINVKVMITFHPQDFLTKIDRGLDISCFYMAKSEKTVSYPLSVSANTLSPLTELAETPQCRYQVLDPATQAEAKVVSVGNRLQHKWTCETTQPDLWCMTVHSCSVEDSASSQIEILNEQGCAVDRFLLDNLQYGPGLLQATKEAHAFKLTDRLVVNFQCSIRLDLKEQNSACPTPKCPDLSKQKAPRRLSKRHAPLDVGTDSSAWMDMPVRAQQLEVLDPQLSPYTNQEHHSSTSTTQRCVPLAYLVVPLSFVGSLIVALLAVIGHLLGRQQHPHVDGK